jgi:hypothetical protein
MALSDGLHFATTLFLSTPTELHDVWLVQKLPFRPDIAATLAAYGYSNGEIDAVEREVYNPVNGAPSLQLSFNTTSTLLQGVIDAYDTVGMHPGQFQAQQIVNALRNL